MNQRILASTVAAVSLIMAAFISNQINKPAVTKTHSTLVRSASVFPASLPQSIRSNVKFAHAGEEGVGNAACEAILADARSGFSDIKDPVSASAYQHGALLYANTTLYLLNRVFPSEVENVLCHFDKDMGILGTTGTVTKTFGGMTISAAIETPTETWAAPLGYTSKGTVTVNDTPYMVLYWGGTQKSSKGFMITGISDLGSSGFLSYIQWDRTSEDQFVNVFIADYQSAYLTTAASQGGADGKGRGDRGMFGRATYNTSTKAFTAQTVTIEAQRVTDPNAFGCYRMYASGIKGGTIQVAKTSNDNNNAGNTTSSANKSLTASHAGNDDMDSFQGTDSSETVNGTGNLSDGQHDSLWAGVNFEKSCNDVLTAGGNTNLFGATTTKVNFSAQPNDIFAQ